MSAGAPCHGAPWPGSTQDAVELGEPVEGCQGLCRLVGEGCGLRALVAGEHMAGGERVSDEYGIHCGHVYGDAARRVPRHPDDHRSTGQIQTRHRPRPR